MQGSTELNTLFEMKFQKFIKIKIRRKTEKELQHFQDMQISDEEEDKSSVSSVWAALNGYYFQTEKYLLYD